ncbi:hypothetical protein EJ05DRAFT_376600 [Pseudovirgaria hyperparasitica]|uniref:Uncharacterized protein n=1 Tax=Pseudovirgaria hyperparasitica TaxID=470096 RepID=A0A6A6W642_9PEZI|nr:uncharacterized protein EJ05DRAFT_376600 [Pseudovirgaria hyperparasitica]KAF2758083.1 hypothetical protein EJ05DRAFT_376600 [Pseudovirgaria hyperparasitica]
MSFGWSVTDVVKLVELSAKVYMAFNDASKNSTVQVQALVRELKNFNTSLSLLQNLLEKYGKCVPLVFADFEKTLKECETFIKPYVDALIDRGKSVNKGYHTIAFAWKDKDVERFRAQIHGHVQALLIHTQYLNLQLTLEAQHLQPPERTLPIPIRHGRLSASSINQTRGLAQTETSDPLLLQDESNRLKDFLEDIIANKAQPAAVRGLGIAQPRLAVSVDLDVLLKLKDDISDVLERAENRNKRIAFEQINHDKHSTYGSPGKMTILETPEGSPIPGIQIDDPAEAKDIWTHLPPRALKEPSRAGTARTVDSGIDLESVYDEYEASSSGSVSAPVFRNPWEESSSMSPTRPRPESVSSVRTVSTISTGRTSWRASHGSAYAVTPGITPLSTPSAGEMLVGSHTSPTTGMVPLDLPPSSFVWQLASDTAELEYLVDKTWRKPVPCTVSFCRRQDGGLSLRATLKTDKGGSVYQHLPPQNSPIPLAMHGVVRNQPKTYITFPQGPRGTYRPPSIKDMKLTFSTTEDCKLLQKEMYHNQELVYSRNVRLVESNKQVEECRNTSVRLFRDGPYLTLLLYTNRRDKPIWIEEYHVAFERLSSSTLRKSSSKDVKLVFSKNAAEHAGGKLLRRLSSMSSQERPQVRRSPTTSSGESSITVSKGFPMNQHKLNWIEIHFDTAGDRNEFVRIWNDNFEVII